ncbi:hypothetical protein GCM10023161_44320 [Mycobacterium paraffinicum]|uniref:HTH cro/C1-type domain-containing protein n=2 Tax=Mycobacterium paraffinicum TaxID=53378 RepID=A0ABP8F412_9MYCO
MLTGMEDAEDRWDPLESLGPTGATVARNIKRLRKARGLAYTDLSARLAGLDRRIPTLGLRKIESGGRRVDVDDLVALAAALNVSPATLMLPASSDETAEVSLTASIPRAAEDVWDWLTAAKPLTDAESPISEGDQWVVFIHDAWPIWRVRQVYSTTFEEMQQRPHGRPARRGDHGDD